MQGIHIEETEISIKTPVSHFWQLFIHSFQRLRQDSAVKSTAPTPVGNTPANSELCLPKAGHSSRCWATGLSHSNEPLMTELAGADTDDDDRSTWKVLESGKC